MGTVMIERMYNIVCVSCVCVCVLMKGIIVFLYHSPVLLFLQAVSDISVYIPLYICLEGV